MAGEVADSFGVLRGKTAPQRLQRQAFPQWSFGMLREDIELKTAVYFLVVYLFAIKAQTKNMITSSYAQSTR